ncbi:uncharacterized protein LOC111889557 [Lactuca sativa]|uniref:uncharacterized protein LOC111889557 n=1 Tax=Lactuca sativa TaxID=4236 RepID=UPI000CD853ED|nr:uncharacterized protein LOC111889557 [Lactuca sativa]
MGYQLFSEREVIKSRRYIITIGNWIATNGDTIFANIYGPHSLCDQKIMWNEILAVKNNKPGNWILFGDFNVVRRSDERFNSQFCPSSASTFNGFIHEATLFGFSMGGEKYTYMSRVGAKLSKLDRFLACPNFLSSFSSFAVTVHARELSDHIPITLISKASDYGPPPFKMFNSWMMKYGFDSTIKNVWSSFVGYGNPDAYLAAKLRYLKIEIKKWIRIVHNEEKKELNLVKNTFSHLKKMAETRTLTRSKLNTRSEG